MVRAEIRKIRGLNPAVLVRGTLKSRRSGERSRARAVTVSTVRIRRGNTLETGRVYSPRTAQNSPDMTSLAAFCRLQNAIKYYTYLEIGFT